MKKIIEIGKRDKYYYGRVISGGITLYKPGEYDYSKCEDEYFLIDDSNGLDRNIYYKNKEDILKVILNCNINCDILPNFLKANFV